MRAFAWVACLAVVVVLAFAAVGCGRTSAVGAPRSGERVAATPACTHRAGWQRLADRIGADVYCPGWLPDPLVAQIGGRWNNIDSVGRDRSYLQSFVWQETQAGINGVGGELHVNLRGYPGRTVIPDCPTGAGRSDPKPCFGDPRGFVRANGIRARLYTVNQGADQWHYALVWRHRGSLYTLSEHLAPPLDGRKLVAYLRRELRALVLIRPTIAT